MSSPIAAGGFPDVNEIYNQISDVLALIFGPQVPQWAKTVAAWTLAAVVVLWAMSRAMEFFKSATEFWTGSVWPRFYDADTVRRVSFRRLFAEHLEGELKRVDRLEDWKDWRFAELEAEVEAEGPRWGILDFLSRATRSGPRTEHSLSAALATSRARLVLVEGDPGSGKSVALRHLAMQFATKGKRSRNVNSVLPIYVNLKELNRDAGQTIDRNLIESFLLKTLNRPNDRDIDEFLDGEFKAGLRNGSWIFLFDSFDELPEVLSATDANEVIEKYRDAIDEFLYAMNKCRGIVASRKFRAPRHQDWPTFVITPLSTKRQRELIRRYRLPREREKALIAGIGASFGESEGLRRSPLFLSLLCEHMRLRGEFPQSAHTAFETYVNSRLDRDSGRVMVRYQVSKDDLRRFAENAAYCMAVDGGMGLSPSRERLKESLERYGPDQLGEPDVFLDALEYVKLARAETASGRSDARSFTFSHRRFQEYFATSVVIRNPALVTPANLLFDGRWRETAVVLCQATDRVETLSSLFGEATRFLQGCLDAMRARTGAGLDTSDNSDGETLETEIGGRSVPWLPAGMWHVLDLLQAGFALRLSLLPAEMRTVAGDIVRTVAVAGSVGSLKDAIEIAGIADEQTIEGLLILGFESRSEWVREVAYRQAARLSALTPNIAAGVRATIVQLDDSRELRREQDSVDAYLRRLSGSSSDLLDSFHLLLHLPEWDLLAHLLALFALEALATAGGTSLASREWMATWIVVSALIVLIARGLGLSGHLGWALYARAMVLYAALTAARPQLLDFGGGLAHLTYVIASLPTIVLLVWLLSFYPSMVVAARTGLFTKLRWRPLVFLAPVMFAARVSEGRRWLRGFLVAAGGGVIGGLIVFGISELWTVVLVPRVRWLSNIGPWLAYGFFAIYGLILATAISRRIFNWVSDQKQLRKIHRGHRPASATLCWDAVRSLRSMEARVSLIRDMRQKRWLAPTTENIAYLSGIAEQLQAESKRIAEVDEVWRWIADLRQMHPDASPSPEGMVPA